MKWTSMGRKALAIAASAAMMTGMAACGNDGGQAAADPNANATIRVAWWGSDSRLKITQEVIDKFEASHPNIKIEAEYSDYNAYFDKLNVQLAGGEAPDLIQIGEDFRTYSDQGQFLDLANVSGQLDLSGLTDSVKKMGQSDGTQYLAPMTTGMLAVLVNTDLLKQYGAEIPSDTDTWTWKDFEDWNREIITKSGNTLQGPGFLNNGYGLGIWASQHGEAAQWDDSGVKVSEPVLTEFFQKFKDWTGEGGVSGSADVWSEGIKASTDQNPFSTKKQAVTIAMANQIDTFAKASGQTIEALPLPSDNQSIKWMTQQLSIGWTINAKTKYPAQTAEFLNYMLNDPEATAILGAERGIPANDKVRQNIKDKVSENNKKALEFTSSMEPRLAANPNPLTPAGARDANNMVMRYGEDVAFGRLSPADAAKQFTDELNAAIQSA
ncbi:ABC transporter substrate-binding protein [Bifidobacterium avesanii]|uniref:Extracellular solute-binding protein n=1 Tax=Bifidobacterium avesanii TaxID=1798157 RepID=A0A7K3TG42_9BIFI|nr:extracellular solute-binding protein [Bifidobacterium avesanii]KAB8295630.1 ABC transporter substrate-binding protein [Bifidobacterium avesanii]NEG77634.1 extracellular solute-binding protein [Bifidobacterium avesanii]